MKTMNVWIFSVEAPGPSWPPYHHSFKSRNAAIACKREIKYARTGPITKVIIKVPMNRRTTEKGA